MKSKGSYHRVSNSKIKKSTKKQKFDIVHHKVFRNNNLPKIFSLLKKGESYCDDVETDLDAGFIIFNYKSIPKYYPNWLELLSDFDDVTIVVESIRDYFPLNKAGHYLIAEYQINPELDNDYPFRYIILFNEILAPAEQDAYENFNVKAF